MTKASGAKNVISFLVSFGFWGLATFLQGSAQQEQIVADSPVVEDNIVIEPVVDVNPVVVESPVQQVVVDATTSGS